MLVNMYIDQTAQDILELRSEAAGARQLAATFDDGLTVVDLLNYANALDREANQLETRPREMSTRQLSSCTLSFEIAAFEVAARPSSGPRFH